MNQKCVSTKHIDVLENEWREPCHVFRLDGVPLFFQLLESGIHIDRIPKHDDVDDKPKGSELILLTFAITLAKLASPTVKYRTGKFMPVFTTIELSENAASLRFIV